MSTFLLKNRKAIHTRIFIPKALRILFGERVEVWKSLRTEDQDEGSYRSSKWCSVHPDYGRGEGPIPQE